MEFVEDSPEVARSVRSEQTTIQIGGNYRLLPTTGTTR